MLNKINESQKVKGGNMSDEGTLTIRKDDVWKYSTFLLLALLVVGGFIFFLGGDNSPTTGNVVANNPQAAAGQQVPAQNARVEASVDDDPVLGKKDAPVTIIEFSDYQCPFCRKFWQDSLPSIKKEYIDTGKAKLVYRDFPLSFHPMAISSAQAANCAREKGGDTAYFKMHDKLFEEQNKLDGGSVKSTVQFTNDDIKKWAKDIGYDIGSCLDSGKFASEIQSDFTEGGETGVQGTPAFFIGNDENGYTLLSGAQPFSAFKQVIDAELAA